MNIKELLDFKGRKLNKMVGNLLNISSRPKTLEKFVRLQNEISIEHDSKVVVITSVGEDKLAAAFAKALADAYVANSSSALIVDANFYNPELAGLLGAQEPGGDIKAVLFNEKSGYIPMKKETYPSNIYKAGTVQKLIEENKDKYEHILVLMPSIKEHKEVVLLKDALDSVILVTRRNVSKKGDIYNSLAFLVEEKIPVSMTPVLG